MCEALIDALTFWRWGFKNVTSSFGVNGFTDELLQTLIELKSKRVLIAYDRDEAGNTAAAKVAKLLNENGIDAFRILFPKGMDANEYALKVTPPQQSLALVIRKAEWLGNGEAPQIITVPITSSLVADQTERLELSRHPIEQNPPINNDQKIIRLM
ncbi:MAG: toprim domain-containing protein [Cellvibrio sp.]|nr:toprim domain-containing protein [Cellvibrio sp.]